MSTADLHAVRLWFRAAAEGPKTEIWGEPLLWSRLERAGLVEPAGEEERRVEGRYRGVMESVIVQLWRPSEKAAVYVDAAKDDRRWAIVQGHLADVLTGVTQP